MKPVKLFNDSALPGRSSKFFNNTNVAKNHESPFLSEWRLATFGFVISLILLVTKLAYSNRESIANLVVERRLISYETIVTDGDVLIRHSWASALKYSNVWFPVLCGLITTWLTWHMVYLDSNVPGVDPPSPFSPHKYRQQPRVTLHINYVFPVLLGSCISTFMYWKDVSLSI